jgi:transcription initiation factor TFIID TATA-box-binding protein
MWPRTLPILPSQRLADKPLRKPMPQHQIFTANLVLTSTLGRPLDLIAMSTRFRFLEYDLSKFDAAIARFTRPFVTLLIFRTGNIVVTAARNVFAARYVIVRLAEMMGIPDPPGPLLVENITSTLNIGKYIPLRRLAAAYYQGVCLNNQEGFPGMIIPTGIGRTSHTLFASGEINSAGARCLAQVIESYNKMVPVYLQHTIAIDSPEAVEIEEAAAKSRKRKAAPPPPTDVPGGALDEDVLAMLAELG